jgi:hypothetical protein
MCVPETKLQPKEKNIFMRKQAKLILSVLFMLTLIVSDVSADCGPFGPCRFGGCHTYDYLSNGDFASNCAWSYSNAMRMTDGQICNHAYANGYAHLYNAYPNPSVVSQVFRVPAQGEAGFVSNSTSWIVGWNAEMYDAGSGWWHQMTIKVYDNDTGLVIASGPTLTGTNVNPNCFKNSFTFNANLNGRNIRLEFKASIQAVGAYFRVTTVSFEQIR